MADEDWTNPTALPRLRRAAHSPIYHAMTANDMKWHGTTIVSVRKGGKVVIAGDGRSEEHTSELQSLMRISYAVFCLKKKKKTENKSNNTQKNQNNQRTHTNK